MKPLSLSVFAIAGCTLGASGLQAQQAVAKKAPQPKRPNILFCIADDATYVHFSAYGCRWTHTPAFDRVAREGILFQNCYTPNAKSAPSRSCVLTGRNSWQLKEAGNHVGNFPAEFRVFTEALGSNGYAVGSTGKGWAPGNPGMADGKVRELTGKVYNDRVLAPPTTGIYKTDYAANFTDFLNDAGSGPWFFWYGGHEPHRGYEYGTGERLGNMRRDMIDHVPAYWPDCDTVRTDMLDYGFEIEWFDGQLGKMLAELERRGLLDNTLVVVTADNGMPFPRSKANDYEFSNHMPLAMRWPAGIKGAGRKEAGYVSFIDFAPTFLDVAGVSQKTSGMQAITGASLRDIIADKQTPEAREARRSILLGRERDDYGRPHNQGYPIRAILRDGILFATNCKPDLYPAGDPLTGYLDIDGSPTKTRILNMWRSGSEQGKAFYLWSFAPRPAEEMYDVRKDPDCMTNLADVPAYAATKEKLRVELERRLREQGDPRMEGNGDIFDNYPFAEQKSENFYERVASGEIREPWRQTNWVNASDYDLYLDKLRKGEVKPYRKKTDAE